MDAEDELKRELMDSFNDHYEEVERGLSTLRNSETSSHPDLLNSIFRSIHSIKGNAGMMQFDNIVSFAHSLENVAESLRSNHYAVSEAICEAVQLGMDRLRDIHLRDVLGKTFDNLREAELINLFNQLSLSPAENANTSANGILRFLSSGLSLENEFNPLSEQRVGDVISIKVDDEKRHRDLIYFQEIALQIDNQSHYWQDRSIQLFEWALKLNKIGGNIVGYEQFAAATYLHDLGMSFLPNDLLEKPGKLDSKEKALLHQHSRWGHDYLIRIPGWEEAARIILDHHEFVDGSGYPNGKKDQDIHPGAKILAIIDAFFSIINGRADRTQRSSVIRAISEINACVNTQFDGMWVQCFNHMVRSEVKLGRL